MEDNVIGNDQGEYGNIGCRNRYHPETTNAEVLIGIFVFLFGIASLAFLSFYMYSRILNAGSTAISW